VEDLQQLKEVGRLVADREEAYREAFALADQIGEQIRRWRLEHGIGPGNSAETLRELREERDDELMGLR
jgi:hypothetical protein